MSLRQTKIIRIIDNTSVCEDLKHAACILRNGGIVAFPTETVYGLGADALNQSAVEDIFTAKGRPSDNPLIIHIAEFSDIESLVILTDEMREITKILADKFWPGPLTLILPKKEKVPEIVTAGLSTVAIRIPSNPVALELIRLAGVPIAAPSANLSGLPSPTSANRVIEDMYGRIDVIIDAGTTDVGIESTVLDLTSENPCILRPGGVTYEMLNVMLPDLKRAYSDEKACKNSGTPKSPGMKYRHYSPAAQMYIFKGGIVNVTDTINKIAEKKAMQGQCAGILASEETAGFYLNKNVIIAGSRLKPESLAHGLFEALRRFDDMKVDIILSEAFDLGGIGEAVMNRMLRAAGGRVIETAFRVLFVCTGNTCRSPMAEYILKNMLLNSGNSDGIAVSSAGTSAIKGLKAAKQAIEVLSDMGIDLMMHRSDRISNTVIDNADIIITMEKSHKNDIKKLFPQCSDKVFTLGEMSGNPDEEVKDPYGYDKDVYLICASQISSMLDRSISRLKELESMKFDII